MSLKQSKRIQSEEIQTEGQISDLDQADSELILEHKLAALFLCMQSQLHVSQSARSLTALMTFCLSQTQTHFVQLRKFC